MTTQAAFIDRFEVFVDLSLRRDRRFRLADASFDVRWTLHQHLSPFGEAFARRHDDQVPDREPRCEREVA